MNGEEIADKMMKVSEYIDHVYPGADTRRYINKIVLRLTVFGTLYSDPLHGASFFSLVMG